ncbi:MAG: phospho-N-acetylmuramoyl-pentapeptide-transferase, partial [Armatimonadetes bacterium]|nr:phospho-N-acetylmuramoyl-pentapeptide-transferase [Armatimonadota bacterium]
GAVMARSTGSAKWQVVAVVWLAAVFAALGFVDDYLKSRHGSTLGVRARYRLPAEAIVALGFVWLVAGLMPASQSSVLGFAGLPMAVRIILGVLVVVGSANAVNLTDGLDGLAGGLTAICAGGLAVVCLIVGAGHLAVLCAVTAGAAAGFLWLNWHPAQIFMGDVGSLGLGALLGGIAVAGGIELIFALIAVVFVGEALSVIIQVIWFRRTGRKVFGMTPIHHTFELRGWAEPQIVVRFWLVGLVTAVVGVVVAMNIA